ncbi:MAG: tetratricopeptide repeat protein [Thermodesulfobacteriota bacterium]
MTKPPLRTILITATFILVLFSSRLLAQEGDLEKAEAINWQVLELYQQGRYAEAVPLAKEALAIREKLLGPEHPDTATSVNNLGLLYMVLGNYPQAEPLLKRSLAVREKVLGPEHRDTSQSVNNLAGFYDILGDYARAEPLLQRALAIREKVLGPEHPDTARSLNNLAEVYRARGKYAEAEPLYERALAIVEKVLGPEHPDTAKSLSNLGLLYQMLGHYAQAEPLYKRALAIREKVLGPEHPDTSTSLNNLAEVYRARGDYTKAEPLYKRALVISEKALGPEHPDTSTSLNNLARLYKAMGHYAQAEPLYKRALAIKEKVLGPEHPSFATSLNNLALLYQTMGHYAQAEPLYRRALAIREKALGPEHPDTARSLDTLAGLYWAVGNYAQAEPLLLRSLAIREKVLGPEHLGTAGSLNNLAGLYNALGDYARAEPLHKRALAILEKVLGPEHPDTATGLNNLAVFYYTRGFYDRAEPLYKRVLAIREKALGPEHPDTATSLNNLAELYRAGGNYAQAEPLYKRALAVWEKALGPEHPNTATSLNNLAGFYYALGFYDQAAPLHKRSLAIREKVLGPEHTDTATSLTALALLYYALGDYPQAEPLFKRSLAIREKALGPEHPETAKSLNNLAGLYKAMGDYARAEPLYKRALGIWEQVLGPGHPDTAIILNNLALLYYALGDYPQAGQLFQRALTIDEQALGPEHPHTATSLNNLATLSAAGGEYQTAQGFFLRAQEIAGKLIDQVLGFAAEDQQQKFLVTQQGELAGALSLISQHLISDKTARRQGLDIWLRRKGVILEAQRRFQEALVYGDDPEAVNTFQELAQVRAQLSRLAFGGPGQEGPEAYRKKIDDLEARRIVLEEKLKGLSQRFAQREKIRRADSRLLAQTLPSGTVLLEFARIDLFDFKARGRESQWRPAHYLAFILPAGQGREVGLLDLGPAEDIENLIAEYKKAVTDAQDVKGEKAAPLARKLYALVFTPLKKDLGEVKEIYISPDGQLNLIPFEVLQDENGRFLIEDYTFNYLASGRDLLGFGQIKGQAGPALLLGDPDFDLDGEKQDETRRRLGFASAQTQEPRIASRSRDTGGLSFGRLPGTGTEVKAIYDLLGRDNARLYTQSEAMEEVVLEQKLPPRMLHLATHGFFLTDQEWKDYASEEGLTGLGPKRPAPGPMAARPDNPLLRSGLALAGANSALQADDLKSSDGLLTAEKVLGLRLQGTDLVVLSACETGLGEVRTGEGVYGLRRAFIQAGTKGLVMSMWSVPDQETQELMVEFYRNILSGKTSRTQALRQAALNEMKLVKERYGAANPLFWGAFVFLGEP